MKLKLQAANMSIDPSCQMSWNDLYTTLFFMRIWEYQIGTDELSF